MAFRAAQLNFSKGVLSKALWSRADITPYNAGVRQATNMVILKYGGMTKRPGTRLVYEIKDGSSRLIPFEGAYEASYAMLLGQASMRLGAGGGVVIEEQLTVEAVTLTNPVQITASYHGYTTGDEVYFQLVEGPDEINGQILPVTVIDDNTFTVPLDGTGYAALTGDEGGIIRTAPPSPPPPPPTVPDPAPPPPSPRTGGSGYGGGLGTFDDPDKVLF